MAETRTIKFPYVHVERERQHRPPYAQVVKSVEELTAEESWTKTGLYCPNCGAVAVWEYDVTHICLACSACFELPDIEKATGKNAQRVAQLKNAAT